MNTAPRITAKRCCGSTCRNTRAGVGAGDGRARGRGAAFSCGMSTICRAAASWCCRGTCRSKGAQAGAVGVRGHMGGGESSHMSLCSVCGSVRSCGPTAECTLRGKATERCARERLQSKGVLVRAVGVGAGAMEAHEMLAPPITPPALSFAEVPCRLPAWVFCRYVEVESVISRGQWGTLPAP